MSFLGNHLGRGEEGMQPLVPTSQGSTGDNQQTVFQKMHHIVHFPSCNFSNCCIGPSRYLWACWQSETWLIISWSFCSKECQDGIAVISLLLPEDPGYATLFNHSNTVLARWKSYFRILKISRGQTVNEILFVLLATLCLSWVWFLLWFSQVAEFIMVVDALADIENIFAFLVSFWFCPLGEKE